MDYFKNILIPADLTVNTEVAVKKALELAGAETIIHLLYVKSFSASASYAFKFFAHSDSIYDEQHIGEQLEQWKCRIEKSVEGIKACTWVTINDSVQEAIEQKAKQLNAGLIIIGKKSHHSWLPFLNTVISSQIAKSTEIPVLTAKPGSLETTIKTIIIPMSGGRPEPKLEAVFAICKKINVKIYLVSFMDHNVPSNFHSAALLMMYQRIRSFSQCPVEYTVLHGSNKARIILEYANKVSADILLVPPDIETRVGWPSRHISDVLPAASKVQVLAV